MHNYIKIHINDGIIEVSGGRAEENVVVALKRTTINFMCKFDKF